MWAPLMKWDMADPALVRKSTLFKVEKNATRLSPWNWPHFQWNRVDFMLFLEPLQAGSSPGVRQVNVQKCPSAVWLTPCDCFQKGQNMLSLLRVFCYPLDLWKPREWLLKTPAFWLSCHVPSELYTCEFEGSFNHSFWITDEFSKDQATRRRL